MTIPAAQQRSVLLIDDDRDLVAGLRRLFQHSGWNVLSALHGDAALELVDERRPGVIVQDLRMPGLHGLELLRCLRHHDPEAAVIVLTGHGDIPVAVEAMHLGAETFLTKPVPFDQLETIARRAQEKVTVRRSRVPSSQPDPFPPLLERLGSSPRMRELARQISVIGETDTTVLLQGETGTGKSWTAQLIHSLSSRSKGPFVEINCGGLNATFLDSELFGHEKGAFTDAKMRKQGLMEAAHGGTLFLDEIADLSPELQPKLLKALETKRFRRIGGTVEIAVDVRLIAATHRPLAEEVKAGRFRADLFYRLSVLPLEVPPLRDRSITDLGMLVHGSIAEIRERIGRGPARVSAEAIAALHRHSWPGNIRELRNVLERTILIAGSADELRPEHLPAEVTGSGSTPGAAAEQMARPLEDVERDHILRVLAHCDGNRSKAARVLGIGRRTLYDKLERFGVI